MLMQEENSSCRPHQGCQRVSPPFQVPELHPLPPKPQFSHTNASSTLPRPLTLCQARGIPHTYCAHLPTTRTARPSCDTMGAMKLGEAGEQACTLTVRSENKTLRKEGNSS